MSAPNPSLIRLEQCVKNREYQTACNELLNILTKLDTNFGGITDIEVDYPPQLINLEAEKTLHFCTRMAVAISTLFCDPNWELSDSGTQRFLTQQRWLALLFASSPYVNADHILQSYNVEPNRENHQEIFLSPTQNALNKFCVMYLPESNILLNLDSMWGFNPELCASLCFALQSPRFIATEQAFSKREAILQWFHKKLATINNLNIYLPLFHTMSICTVAMMWLRINIL